MKTRYSLLFCLLWFLSYAQAPSISWMKRYGGLSQDIPSSLIQTQDGGFLLGGTSNSGITGLKSEDRIGYTPDYWVVKTNNFGNIQWQKTIGGGMPVFFGDLEAEILRKVRESNDGGYFLGGNSDSPEFGSKTEPNYGMQDYWIVKINNIGDIVWQKDIGGSDYDECYSLEPTSDGGCIVGGYSKSGVSGNKTEFNRGLKDYWVIKLSSSGQIEWQKSYGGNSDDILYSITILDNQEFLLVGMSASNISGEKTENSKGGGDFWIIKIDSIGTIIWQKTIGGDNSDQPFNAKKVSDGFIFSGSSRSNISFDKSENSRGGEDYWVVKTDLNGNVIWDRTYGGSLDDYANGFASMSNESGFVIVGSSYSDITGDKTVSNFGEYNGWVVRIDQNGELLWQKGIGGSYQDGLNQVLELQDNSILLGGGCASSISGNLSVGGYGGTDYWLVKLEAEQLGFATFSSSDFVVYPNPVQDFLSVQLHKVKERLAITIYNTLSQLVTQTLFYDTEQINFPVSLSKGLYIIKIVDEQGKEYRAKFLKN